MPKKERILRNRPVCRLKARLAGFRVSGGRGLWLRRRLRKPLSHEQMRAAGL